MDFKALEWNEELLDRYAISGPRYTSYPTALEFSDSYLPADYTNGLASVPKDQSLSLYIHIPFCKNICYYCACNKVITKDQTLSIRYVYNLIKEIEIVAKYSRAKTVRQIHWGGGTPTFLKMKQIESIMDAIRTHFDVVDDESSEISIEVDPRSLEVSNIKELSRMGFNRMSLGVQDFDDNVQKSVNRIQSFEMTLSLVLEARRQGFCSINIDLIYGLPLQTISTFKSTLEKVMVIDPDRISIFNYAHLPHRFKPQRRINNDDLPSPMDKIKMFSFIIASLQSGGYQFIGMDHFAKPSDELAVAQQESKLHRNFQGYTTHGEYEQIGLGVSAISSLSQQYHQNTADLESYNVSLEQKKLPSWRGIAVNQDDKVRKTVILELICHFYLSKSAISKTFNIDFNRYFENELRQLKRFQEDELIRIEKDSIQITPKGRLFVRNICMVFDAYLNEFAKSAAYSKII